MKQSETSLVEYSKSGIKKDNDGNYVLSRYTDELIDGYTVAKELGKVTIAFKDLHPDFIGMLAKQMKEHGFTKQRAADAVNHVIATCIYPRPTIAQFISFDKTERLYTHHERNDFAYKNGIKTGKFEMVEIGNKKLWRLK